MTRELERFIRIYLNEEQAHDVRRWLRPTLHAFKNTFVDGVRDGLESVLRTRELSVGDYERLTNIEFVDEKALYGYLHHMHHMHQYLFADGGVQVSDQAWQSAGELGVADRVSNRMRALARRPSDGAGDPLPAGVAASTSSTPARRGEGAARPTAASRVRRRKGSSSAKIRTRCRHCSG
ncbi:hypothetical protein ACFWY6_31740 [Streptomyces sp. NPDC059037]|uniref:hypothetical protein n=1 Tax=Streptomyces sp. NPDC059037 TaxID=3346710 RepID=UPI0036AED2FE